MRRMASLARDRGRELILAEVREMAEVLDHEQFFLRLEQMIDQVRKDLELVPEAEFREELREIFKEVIDYALSVKLKDAFTPKIM